MQGAMWRLRCHGAPVAGKVTPPSARDCLSVDQTNQPRVSQTAHRTSVGGAAVLAPPTAMSSVPVLTCYTPATKYDTLCLCVSRYSPAIHLVPSTALCVCVCPSTHLLYTCYQVRHSVFVCVPVFTCYTPGTKYTLFPASMPHIIPYEA